MLKEQRRRQLENNYHEFVKDAFSVMHIGESLVDNWHIQYVCGRIQDAVQRVANKEHRIKHLIINIPPRSLKSRMATIYITPWMWIKHPTLKIISTSYSGDLSLEHNVKAKTLIESPFYQDRWGDKYSLSKTINTKENFETTKMGVRKCTSTGGTITGSGGDVIIIDDPINPKKAASDTERKAANDYFSQTLSTRLNNPKIGLFIIIMQRLHEDDLTGYLMKEMPDRFEHICIPAELTNDVKPKELRRFYKDGLYFPARHDRDFLNDQYEFLGSAGYNGQYLQTPKGVGGNRVKGSWFGRFNMRELPQSIVWHFVIDPAYTKDTINDPSGFMAFAEHNNNMYIRSVSSGWFEFPALLKYIKSYVVENGYTFKSKIYIEPKASGLSAAQSLKAHTGLNVIIDKPPTTDKVSRFEGVTPTIEAGRVYLLDKAHWLREFVGQVEMFPNAKHDEYPDLLSMSISRIKNVRNRSPKTKVLGGR